MGVSPVSVVAFVLLLVAFVWPGYRVAQCWLASRSQPVCVAIALGLTISLGGFSALNGPLLLLHASFSSALMATVACWVLSVITIEMARRYSMARSDRGRDPKQIDTALRVPQLTVRRALALVGLTIVVLLSALGFSREWLPRQAAAMLLVIVAAVTGATATWLRRRSYLATVPMPRGVRHALWAIIAVVVAGQAVSTLLYVREDADDTLYLSEIIALIDSPAMASEEPTHRGEGLPPYPVRAWSVWELWGAMLCKMSGLHSMVAFRTIMPLVLIGSSYPMYAALLRQVVPRCLVPVGLIALAGYFTVGMSSHWTAANFFLPRAQQGKSFLIHVGVVAVVFIGWEFLKSPRKSTWILGLTAALACLAWSPTAVFLIPATLSCLALSAWIVDMRVAILVRGLILCLTVVAEVLFGAFVALRPGGGASPFLADGPSSWIGSILYRHLNFGQGGGVVEVAAVVAAPLLAVFVADRKGWAYPLVFAFVLLGTFLNPVAFAPISNHLTTPIGYDRLAWALPFGSILAVFAAGGTGVLLAKSGRPMLAIGSVVATIVTLPLLGGRYVWSPSNLYYEEDAGGLYRAANALKMPAGLLVVANRLVESNTGPTRRILCSERDAMHLAPFHKRFNFVYTRSYQTAAALQRAGLESDLEPRRRLARDFLEGAMSEAEAAPALAKYGAEYVVTAAGRTSVEAILTHLGYVRLLEVETHSLWQAP